MDPYNWEKILEVESKYRHLDSFSDNPVEDVLVLHAFGRANYECSKDEICYDRSIDYFERAKERVGVLGPNAGDQHQQIQLLKRKIGICLVSLYAGGRDMEKAISSHRWFLDCNRHKVKAMYVNRLSRKFNGFGKFEYAIEVLEGSMGMMETVEDEDQAETNLILAYIGCGEFLKAKAAHEKRRTTHIMDGITRLQSGMIEEGLCNYAAAIAHFRKVAAGLQMQEYDDSLYASRFVCSMHLAKTLLQQSTDNEDEAFAIFQKELDRCVDPLDREKIFLAMGTEYGKIKKWDQSIEALNQLCLSSTRPDGTIANEAMAQTYLEQYCIDTTLTIDQRTQILCHANIYSLQVDGVLSTEMHLTQAQLSYFNGDKHEAYHHLELYLDARLAECKLTCYTCKQRVRHGSVPFSCASCGVASYCGRKHQKMTWKNERICHKVLCPLFGYWRMAKKKKKEQKKKQKQKKKHKKQKGLTNDNRRECERVFETFFESICPHVKTCVPSYYDGLTFVD